MEPIEGTRSLIQALGVAVDANKRVRADADEWLLDAEGLAVKCLFHGSSCVRLHSGTALPGFDATVLDIASMNVVARATIESFLTFHYVFASPQDSATRELRHLAWVLSDLLERQDFRATEPANRQQLADEREQIETLRIRIGGNPVFQKMTPKQKRRLLEDGEWRWQSWSGIARDAGMSELHADQAYRYLCSFAHSGSLSVLQVRQAKSAVDQKRLADGTLRLVNVAVAFMTKAYSSLFPKAGTALATEDALAACVAEWVRLGTV